MKKTWLAGFLIMIGCTNNRELSNEFNKKGLDYSRKGSPELLRSDKNIEDSVLYFFSEAIRIDSTNKGAYWTKLGFENYYNRTDDAKKTAQLFYRKFNDPYGLMSLGRIHLKLGDTIQSKKYFKEALLFYKNGIKSREFIEDSNYWICLLLIFIMVILHYPVNTIIASEVQKKVN